jgi:hypothetical protein
MPCASGASAAVRTASVRSSPRRLHGRPSGTSRSATASCGSRPCSSSYSGRWAMRRPTTRRVVRSPPSRRPLRRRRLRGSTLLRWHILGCRRLTPRMSSLRSPIRPAMLLQYVSPCNDPGCGQEGLHLKHPAGKGGYRPTCRGAWSRQVTCDGRMVELQVFDLEPPDDQPEWERA